MADSPVVTSTLDFDIDPGTRLGRLGPNLETPCLLLPTSSGSLPFLSADLASTLPPFASLLDLAEVLDFMKLDHPSKYTALPPSTLTILSATSMVNQQLEVASNNGMLIETANGRKEVTPSFLLGVAKALEARMVVAMSDEPAFGSTRKRIAKAVDRTTTWLKQSSLEATSDVCLLGVVPSSADSEATKRAADIVAGHKLRGVVVGVPTRSDESNAKERAAGVAETLAAFPASTIRLAPSGFSSPSEVLTAVEMGVDVIGTSYANSLTENGLALALPILEGAKISTAGAEGNKRQKTDPQQVLNLRDNGMRRDQRPLVDGCTCHCCTNHHRAYLHHLLIAREMTGEVLLQLHNTHHMLDFMEAVRKSRRDGTFQDLKKVINGP